MIRFFLYLLLFAASGVLHAQQGLQPLYHIPAAIAKIPERGDFSAEWLRSDGTYRLLIDVTDGSVEAKYFNPDPIHVESAAFAERGDRLELVVVLRDTGYPGSTYNLRYNPERMILVGTYSRPGSPPGEVYFVKRSQSR